MSDSPPLQGLRSPREVLPFDDFPPDDLLDTLVELFFRKSNDLLPLLHEPLFKRSIREGLHLRHGGFGATVLLVCANAARFTEDPRVLLDGSDDRHSAGWRWYQQVENTQRLELSPATLYELQLCAVRVIVRFGYTLLTLRRPPIVPVDDTVPRRLDGTSDYVDSHREWNPSGDRRRCTQKKSIQH